jgi:tetratricopeptide (TPR) repeat protein
LSVAQTLNTAKRLAKAGNNTQAGQLYRSVLEQFPKNKHALAGLSGLRQQGSGAAGQSRDQNAALQKAVKQLASLYQQGRFEPVIAEASRLAAKFPLAVLHNMIGASRAGLSDLDGAAAAFEKAVALSPGDGELHKNLGYVQRKQGRMREAAASLKLSLQLLPGDARVWAGLGYVLNSLGKTAEAAGAFEKALKTQPGLAEAWFGLSITRPFAADDVNVTRMREMLTRSDLSNADRAQLCSAMGNTMEHAREYDDAFDFFAERNRIYSEMRPFDLNAEKALLGTAREIFGSDQSRQSAGADAPDLSGGTVHPHRQPPVFILGMPRSGTSLAEQIFASHSQVFGGGELAALGRAASELAGGAFDTDAASQLRQKYSAAVDRLGATEPVVTDKMPHNFRCIGHILTAFPGAKIIHMQRDPRAVCWSNFKSDFGADKHLFSSDLNDLVAYYDLYLEWMTFWEQCFPGRVRHQSYEELTRNQEEQSRELLAWIGLPWEEQCLQFHKSDRAVKTVSASQVREPIYQGSSEKWRRYEKFLTPLTDRFGTGTEAESPPGPRNRGAA